MGAGSSFAISKNIYISYDYREKSNEYIKKLRSRLEKEDYNIIYSESTCEGFELLSSAEISKKIENIMDSSYCLIICLSKETLRSYYQTIEINSALDSKKEIIYIMLDEDYTPSKNQTVKSIVKQQNWYPLYHDEHLSELIENITYV